MKVSGKLENRLQAVREAARALRAASTARKNQVLLEAAKLLIEREAAILKANAADLKALPKATTPAFRDRLALDQRRLGQMVESLRQVAELADPVDELVEERALANGLRVKRVRAPLGVILMIFESRPNVAMESFSLAFKAGNAVILRGGRESMRTTAALYAILSQALQTHGFPGPCVWGITDPDRALVKTLLAQDRYIDIVVPRGGGGLIRFVVENARMPIIKNDRGLCHVYVHADADSSMAEEIVVNAKTQRPGVCNAMETLLVHRDVAQEFLPRLYERLEPLGVRWFGCPATRKVLGKRKLLVAAKPANFDVEYLDLKMNVKVVQSLDEAIEHIDRHGSRHSESIVTRDETAARSFQAAIDAAAVYWNASTRFTDGFELGLGGELGISTQKLHVRGPVGLRELTSARWVIDGSGQVRK